MRKIIFSSALTCFGVLLAGCTAAAASPTLPATELALATPSPAAVLRSVIPSATSEATTTKAQEPSATPATDGTVEPTPVDWKSLPVLPTVSDELRAIYLQGIENGNDPHAFSFLGDCLSQPDVFMGTYGSDPAAVAALPDGLQETVANFASSFDRYSPAVKDGTTTGALLWGEWNDNEEGFCEAGESPLDCELRVHRPSIVFIHIGTHWETRNYRYLTMIVERILESGAVPVLATKADDRELDERVNQDVANLAAELGIPVWNFWASVQVLPNGGVDAESSWELTEDAMQIHRLSALEALDAVWRAVRDNS